VTVVSICGAARCLIIPFTLGVLYVTVVEVRILKEKLYVPMYLKLYKSDKLIIQNFLYNGVFIYFSLLKIITHGDIWIFRGERKRDDS